MPLLPAGAQKTDAIVDALESVSALAEAPALSLSSLAMPSPVDGEKPICLESKVEVLDGASRSDKWNEDDLEIGPGTGLDDAISQYQQNAFPVLSQAHQDFISGIVGQLGSAKKGNTNLERSSNERHFPTL